MQNQRMMVFSEMRPPVAAEDGNTPLRGKNVSKLLDMAAAEYTDENGFRLTKDQILKNYTDDAGLADKNWNVRHHVTPSAFNGANHKYYKQYFDKDFKNKQNIHVQPQRQLDPYEENEAKGTRMPDYTKLAKERDIYGELGWVSNFNVKFSKNNGKMHPTYREFFDMPKNYSTQFNNSSVTNQEFFRQNAPQGSVARLTKRDGSMSPVGASSSVGFKSLRSSGHKRSGTLDPNFQGSQYATPFLLQKDVSNRHKVAEEVKRTVPNISNDIPFLRTQIDPMRLSKTHHGTFMGQYIGNASGYAGGKEQMRQIKLKRMQRKETGWDNNIKPISKFNSQVHPSMRIPFEQI